jgi:hypothetical protein
MRRMHAGAALALLLLMTGCGATADPSVIDLRPVRVERAVAGQGNELVLYYTGPGSKPDCHKLGRADVVETADVVTVTLQEGRLPSVDCTGPEAMWGATWQTTVTLKAPLGDRAVRYGYS